MPRSVTVLGTAHSLQRFAKVEESIEDSGYEKLLRQLLAAYTVDFIFEEAQGLGPSLGEQIAVTELGPERYEDVDPPKSAWQSLGIQETREGCFIGEPDLENQIWPFALQQVMPAHEKREQLWLHAIIGHREFKSGLMICGDHHLFSFSFRLIEKGFSVNAFSYMPTIYENRVIWPKIQKTPQNPSR